MGFPSPAPKRQVEPQEVPLQVVGGSSFGRYNKISDAQSWNMISSDGWLVDYAAYRNVFLSPLVPNGVGRGIYSSSNGNIMVVVMGSAVYAVNSNLVATFVGELATSVGDVFIAENNSNQVAIADESFVYVYNYVTQTFLQSTQSQSPTTGYFFGPFIRPGYISFHLGRLIVADIDSQNWWLSGINDATQWSLTDVNNIAYVGAISLKPDTVQAVVPVPGAANNIAVFGHTVLEMWQFTGNALFPYQRNSTFNVDYGCLNASSIAALDFNIVWLSSNEQSGATVMRISGAGSREESISTDGIDFKLANLSDPTNCTGFLMRQDGHLLYQFTFPTDNLSYVYDFDTKLFFNVSDENQNYHIARNVVFYNNDYYFASLNDTNLYSFGTQYTNLQYSATEIYQMPRIRICPPLRIPSQRMFICKSIGFTIENGQPNDDNTECIDLRISRDGGESFGSAIRYYMNATGNRKSRLIFQSLGQQNDLTVQIQFIGFGRFLASDGVCEIYT